MKKQIEVGDKAVDKVTKIEGIVVVRHDYLYGCARIGIQPEGSHDGKPHEVLHIDLPQGNLLKKKAVSREGMEPVKRVDLGSEIKCRITGFQGICAGRAEWLYSCTKVLIQSRELRKGKPIDGIWVDEPQAEIIKEKVIAEAQKNTGGPCPSVSHHNKPSKK